MTSDDRSDVRLWAEHILGNSPELTKKLVESPREVLDSLGVDESAIKGPEAVHEMVKRANTFEERVRAIDEDSIVDILPKVADCAVQAFGPDYQVEKVPFGIRFSERVPLRQPPDATGTGSGTITFASTDTDTDIDG